MSEHSETAKSSLYGRPPPTNAGQQGSPQAKALTKLGSKPASPRCISCTAWLMAIGVFVVVVVAGVAASLLFQYLLDSDIWKRGRKPQQWKQWLRSSTQQPTSQQRKVGGGKLHVETESSGRVTVVPVASTHDERGSRRTAVVVADSDKVASSKQELRGWPT